LSYCSVRRHGRDGGSVGHPVAWDCPLSGPARRRSVAPRFLL